MPEQFLQTLCERAKQTDFSSRELVNTAKDMNNQIRKIDKQEAFGELLINIPLIAQEYGARTDIPQNVIKEAITLITTEFMDLSVSEIRKAYRMYASGKLNVNAEMYGGEFTVAQLGKVLTAYRNERRARVAAVLQIENKEREDRIKEAEAIQKRIEFEKTFPSIVADKIQYVTSWRDIPEWWYKPSVKLGLLDFTKEQADVVFQQAADLVDTEQARQREQSKNEKFNMETVVRRELTDEQLQRVIARKLIMFKKLKR